ncbi:AAA family ATPase [Paenarthrobacter sp. CCNWLY172]|uniref:AAA family ATPase n=1 Tax=unclassified Paenarthrobacter TaxID=2634190 RepID=UPI00307759A0
MTPDIENPPAGTEGSSPSGTPSILSINVRPLTRADLSAEEHALRTELLRKAIATFRESGQELDDVALAALEATVIAKIAEARQHIPLSPVMAASLKQLPSLHYQVDYGDLNQQAFQALVDKEYRTLLARDTARRQIESAQRTDLEPKPPVRLDKLLLQPDEDPEYRIDGLHPTGGRVMLLAMRKTGKSTLVGNLARCLVDDYPLFGRFRVEPVERLLIIDNELDERTSKRWLRDQGIKNTHRVDVLHLRGQTGTFNILDPVIRSQWARRCEGVDLAFFDCLRPILDALGLSEDKDAGRFLVAFDAFLAEAGIGEAVVVHHMGHSGERARGDSRIQDWPDAIWKLVAEDPEDHSSPRFFSAYGRDVNVPEFQLDFESTTRHLTHAGGSRKDGKIGNHLEAVIDFVILHPGVSRSGIKEQLRGDDKVIASAVDRAVELGRLEERPRLGRGGGKAYFPAPEPKPGTPVTPVNPVNPSAPMF